jgi:outer membrane protein assembly factor BamD
MKRVVFVSILLGAFLFFTAPAFSFWVWTPRTGRWVNPKYSVKPNPREQLDFAKEFYNQGKYKEAIEECKKLLKYYPKSYQASEAQFYIGLSLEAMDKLYKAYQAYQKVIDKYPFSARIDEIIERQLKIGEVFVSGEKRKALGVRLPVENPAIEILRKVIDNSPYGKNAARAQYLLGMVFEEAGRFQEAHDEFEKVITTYPESEWVSLAKYHSAYCASKIVPEGDYDQELTRQAKEKFEEFVKTHPDEALRKEAISHIDTLKEKEAEGALKIAEFYEKQKKYNSARIYYQEIVNNCPYCQSATRARDKLKELEKK